jgi:tetratricopeptide (TPR) repeat protein
MPLYDAFISYSHAKDKPIASALQSAIQRLGKPWYRRRALRLFRDDTSLSATPGLWPSIEQALANSRFLILLASPQAAASSWVNKEVAYWLEHKRAETLLIAVTEGELVWDEALGDFAWREGKPLPSVLTGRFATEPKWVDLRAYRESTDKRDARFTESASDFAAAIHGMPKEDLLSQEVRQQRRALTLAWSAAGSLLILAGLAGWQWKSALDAERAAIEQRRIAQTQRDRAEYNFAIAKQAADDVVFRLAQNLRDVQGMRVDSVRKILDAARTLMDQIAQAAPDDPQLQRSRAAMLSEFTETFLRIGDLTRAQGSAEEALAIMRKLAAADPGNAALQRDVYVIVTRLGGVQLAAGARAEALAAFEEGLAIIRKIAAAAPNDAGLQRDVSVSLYWTGDVRLAAGDRPGALAAYEEGLAIMRKLAAADPGNAEWLRNMTASLDRVGDVRLTTGDRAGALAAYEESLTIRRQLAAADPGNTDWKRNVSVSLDRIGEIRLANGNRAGALSALKESLAIMRKLAAADPGNAVWQRDVSVSLDRIGDINLAADDRSGAISAYEESLAIIRRLAAADPGNIGWQRDVAVSLAKVGDARLDADDFQAALSAYEESLAIGASSPPPIREISCGSAM